MKTVTIIDYGAGNILSVRRAFENFGATTIVTEDYQQVKNAERLVLPGVGAFRDGMSALKNKLLHEAITEYAALQRPFLGICLGMQMMLDKSEEFGIHTGLGLINGVVKKIDDTGTNGQAHKIPHVSWNTLTVPQNMKYDDWSETLLENIAEGSPVYFVHSYTAWPSNENHRLADTFYDGRRISAVIRKDNLYGCQFHPEKSGEIGLHMIRNFLSL